MLDVAIRMGVLNPLPVARDRQLAILLIKHDLSPHLADRILVLYRG
jgi:ABC-type dipeptide/oligopeptide/nickel transport system ATPase subunit